MLWGTTRMDSAIIAVVLRHLLLVSFTLVAVYGLLDGVRELRYLSSNYGLVDVIWYLLLTTPRRAYQVFPFAALVGVVVAVGGLAATSELVAWRALGATRARLLVPVVIAVSVMLAAVVFVAEQWATELELKARSYRLAGITGQVSLSGPGGLWLRDGKDFLHIKYPFLDQSLSTDFHDIKVYEVDTAAAVTAWMTAVHGRHEDRHWHFEIVHRVELSEQGASHEYFEKLMWPSQLDTAALGTSVLRPSLLSIRQLNTLLNYFNTNSLDDAHYRAALWRRYYYTLIVWSAVLLGLPFVLSLQGRESRTRALAIAVAVGLTWYVVERLFQSVVLALSWSPVWGGLIPVLIAAVLSVYLMRRHR